MAHEARKVKRFKVTICGTLPATAYLEVEAKTEDEAREYAEEHSDDADWDGADYSRPDGCTHEILAITEIKES